MKKASIISTLLFLMVILGCYAFLVTAPPAVYVSNEIGVKQAPVEFTRTELAVDIDAPVETVWDKFTDLNNFTIFYPWVDEFKPKGKIQRLDKIGDGIEYFVSRGDMVSKGAAILTKVEPHETLVFTLFATYRGSQELHFETADAGTELTYVSYIELIPPERGKEIDKEGILQAREDNVRTTLSAIKGLSEGTLSEEDAKGKKRRIPLAGNVRRSQKAVDLHVTRGVIEIESPSDQVWESLVTTENLPRFFSWLYKSRPLGDKEKWESVGDGVQFRSPKGGGGTALITRIEPGKELYLSLFTEYRGGQEFIVEPLEGERTRLIYLSYVEIPEILKGEKVDKDKVLAGIENQTKATLNAIKAFNEVGAIIEKES